MQCLLLDAADSPLQQTCLLYLGKAEAFEAIGSGLKLPDTCNPIELPHILNAKHIAN